jgi:hypothetical protein
VTLVDVNLGVPGCRSPRLPRVLVYLKRHVPRSSVYIIYSDAVRAAHARGVNRSGWSATSSGLAFRTDTKY